LSFSGVFYGYVIANMDFVILMTMMGIISLAGIVVKNGIVLMDFFVLLLDNKVAVKQLESHDDLRLEEIKEVIIESGKSRLRPVLLTALTAVLGLIPFCNRIELRLLRSNNRFESTLVYGWRQRNFLGTIGLDYYLRIDLRHSIDFGNGSGNVLLGKDELNIGYAEEEEARKAIEA
jgi:hypothetical protein